MADLSRRGRRGQILLITAFVLAVIFVGLALVMNTVIYSENLATRADTTTSQPILHANSMETGTEEVIRYINTHNTSKSTDYPALRTTLDEAFDNISDISGRHSLRDGQVTHDELGPESQGTWIRQTDETRIFSDAGNAKTWTPVSGASGARTLRIFVNTASVSGGSSAFTMEAQGMSGTWTLRVGSDQVSGTDSTGNSFSCAANAGGADFWVNVSTGTVNDDDCSGLHFADHLDPIDRVDYDNAENITGTYRWIANETESGVDTGQYSDVSGPFVEKGIYGARIKIDFERANLAFRTDRRVIPGADDD